MPASGKTATESTVSKSSKKRAASADKDDLNTMVKSTNTDSASLNTFITAENDIDDWDPFEKTRKRRQSSRSVQPNKHLLAVFDVATNVTQKTIFPSTSPSRLKNRSNLLESKVREKQQKKVQVRVKLLSRHPKHQICLAQLERHMQ